MLEKSVQGIVKLVSGMALGAEAPGKASTMLEQLQNKAEREGDRASCVKPDLKTSATWVSVCRCSSSFQIYILAEQMLL